MKKILLALVVVAFSVQSNAQLTVNLQLPPLALTLKNQLWNMMLINTSGQGMQLRVEFVLTDVTGNVTVLTASSTQFNLAPGGRQMQAADFLPITYTVVSQNYNIDNNPNGFLPVGQFNICYQFIKIVQDFSETLTEECETLEIEPISPPILVFPEDDARIETPRPVFSWVPPAPAGLFSNLSYDFRLVEVMSIQAPADAIQQNIAVYADQNINLQSTLYPSGLPALDTGKLYAWQVTANNNSAFIAKSDIWTFRVGVFGSDGQEYFSGEAFAKLKPGGHSTYFICTGTLKFYYDNRPGDDTVTVAVYALNDPQTMVYTDSNYALGSGQNFMKIDLSAIEGVSNNQLYIIELINSKRERWSEKFLYKRDEQ